MHSKTQEKVISSDDVCAGLLTVEYYLTKGMNSVFWRMVIIGPSEITRILGKTIKERTEI